MNLPLEKSTKMKGITGGYSTYPKGRVSCFADPEVSGSLIKLWFSE